MILRACLHPVLFWGLSVDKAYSLLYNETIFKNEGTELCADVNIFNLTIKI